MLRKVAGLPDPVGQTVDGWVRPNGLEIRQVRVPLGVVGIIYENRPNVTSDAAGLCLKSGNAAFLRGSSAALRSNQAIAPILRDGYEKVGLPADALLLVEDTSRESAREFMRLRGVIDCLIPRGGPSLIQAIQEHATVPYVHRRRRQLPRVCRSAPPTSTWPPPSWSMARPSGRASATPPSPSWSTEAVADPFPAAGRGRRSTGSSCAATRRPSPASSAPIGWPPRPRTTTGESSSISILSVKVVGDLDEAIDHVRRYSCGHTEAIVTGDLAAAQRFQREVDAAAVVVNASTRFTDGEEFGFGAEIGISTQKLHARGPMGLRELTTTKYLLTGTGQIRA